MKKTLLTLLFAATAATTFSQGKVNLINDAASLVVLTTDTYWLKAADVAQAGVAVGNLTPLNSRITLAAGLYGGTSSSSLFLYSTVLLNNPGTPGGYIPATHIILNAQANGAPLIYGIANGTPIGPTTPWFQVRVWDSAYPTYEQAWAACSYATHGAEFQMNPGPSLSYPNTAPAGINSTWVDAPFTFGLAPEPSPFALGALGMLVLVILRRPRSVSR